MSVGLAKWNVLFRGSVGVSMGDGKCVVKFGTAVEGHCHDLSGSASRGMMSLDIAIMLDKISRSVNVVSKAENIARDCQRGCFETARSRPTFR
jgi:hypothetical protein